MPLVSVPWLETPSTLHRTTQDTVDRSSPVHTALPTRSLLHIFMHPERCDAIKLKGFIIKSQSL